MYRVAGLKCLTHIYTGFHTSRDKGSLMKLLPLDLRFPKSKLMSQDFAEESIKFFFGVGWGADVTSADVASSLMVRMMIGMFNLRMTCPLML